MKILINIPDDHKRVIDNLVSDGKGYLLPQEVETRLAKAVKIGTVIPDNATNGDMILNMFDTATVYGTDKKNDCITICIDNNFYQKFSYSWWNAPYESEE